MVVPEFGDAATFEERDLPTPEPGPGELRVRVRAAAVNPIDVKARRNGDEMGIEPPAVLGYDASGVVDAVGPGVTEFDVGDEVFYTPELFDDGCYAEYNVVPARLVAAKPASLTHVEAASLPVVASTAWSALLERGDLRLGDEVLVHGAGGVGQQAIQIAAAAGATVFAIASPATTGLAERLGASRAVDYRSADVVDVLSAETEDGVDLVLDTVGGGVLERSLPVIRRGGRAVDIVGEPGDLGDAKGRNVGVEFMSLVRTSETIRAVRRLVESDRIEPVVDATYPLSDVAEAHERLESGGVAGKLVLEIGE